MLRELLIGTRGSRLATAQAEELQQIIQQVHPDVGTQLQIIRTRGDEVTDVPLPEVGQKGIFTREIEQQLLEGAIQLAVHSAKDMPVQLPEGLVLAAVLPRRDALDALVSKVASSIEELPQGAIVGTSSLRRACQLRFVRPDLQVVPLRGNVDTRLRKLEQGQDGMVAIITAMAALTRLGIEGSHIHPLPIEVMVPAVGQGALAVEARVDDSAVRELLQKVNDLASMRCVRAERALLSTLGGGCHVPIAAHAALTGGRLELHAMVGLPDGSNIVRHSLMGYPDDPEGLAEDLAGEILEKGARQILEQL